MEIDMKRTMAEPRRCEIAGMYFDMSTENEVVDVLSSRDPQRPFEYIVTPNVDHTVRCRRMRLRPLYSSAWYSLCDSRVMARLARLVGMRAPDVITGSDLTHIVMERIVKPGDTITIIGCNAAQVDVLRQKYPGVVIHHFDPPMGFAYKPGELERAANFVVEHPARFVFLAVGSPQQERLAFMIRRKKATGIGLCIGASILFLTGGERRAPHWVQRSGFEWMYRLLQNPGRLWRRYLVEDPVIFGLIAQQRLRELRK